ARLDVAGAVGAVVVDDAAGALVAGRVAHRGHAAAQALALGRAHDARARARVADRRRRVDARAGGVGVGGAVTADAGLVDAERLVGVPALVVALAADVAGGRVGGHVGG